MARPIRLTLAVLTLTLASAGVVAFQSPAPAQPAAPTMAPAAAPARPAERPLTVKVAAVQCSSDLGEVEANRRKLTALVEEAAANGAKIIVLPETAVTGYLSQDLRTNWHLPGRPLDRAFRGKHPAAFAEPVPGPSTRHFAALAKRLGVYVTVPLLEVEKAAAAADGDAKPRGGNANPAGDPAPGPPADRYFNTVCLAAPTGELVAHYRKLTPWPHPEQSWATPGDRGVQTFDTEYGRVGLAICYDIHTVLDRYLPERIWALLYPIAWVDGEHPAGWFWHKLPARAGPYGHHIIGANWSVDAEQSWRGYGFSTILAPGGKVVATAKSLHGSEIVYATIPTAWAEADRK